MSNTKEKLPHEVLAIFPLPIYKTNIGREFTKQEQDELDAIINEQLIPLSPGAGGPAMHGLVSEQTITKYVSTDKYVLNRKSFLSIHSFIQHHLKEFVTTVIGIDIDKTNWSPHITQSWLNTYKSNHYDPPHDHTNCIISGVFYINCLELSDNETDGIVFAPTSHHMINQFYLPIAQSTIFSDRPFHVSVVGGDLILFPSTAKHAVDSNKTLDQTRISLSFNSI